jgi:dATP pyrophosphohydrolase
MNIRHDMIQCHVARRSGSTHEFLQLLRSPGRYMERTWQLVAGGIIAPETAWQAALRELREETALRPAALYQLNTVNVFYIAKLDALVHSPAFCAIVDRASEVKLNDEHSDFRWEPRNELESKLMWPAERVAFAELCREILDDGPAKPYLHIPLDPLEEPSR